MTDRHDEPAANGYGQYCPISRAVEVLGERWSLLIVRDLLTGNTRFNDLARSNPGLSRSLLAKRLRQLERAGIVEHADDRYVLSEAGSDLREIVFGLGRWGARWQFGPPREEELDPELVMWWVHARIDFTTLPDRRIVLQFHFPELRRRFWIMNDRQGPSVCFSDPGFEVDAVVEAALSTLYEVWLGRRDLNAAIRSEAVRLMGVPAIVRQLPGAFALSDIAPIVREECAVISDP